jgi:hypothetical protein
MIAFVTTIRHPDNCASWDRVGRLLDASLRSVLGQLDVDFRVVVVHNRRPHVSVSDSRIVYVEVGFPPPSEQRTPRIEFSRFRRDKGSKCAIGVVAARELGADHVMFFDADDYLHNGLAGLANGSPDHPGWYSPQGWIHTAGSRSIQFVPERFHNLNGSTSIVRTDLIDVPPMLAIGADQEEVLSVVGEAHVCRMLGEHGWWEDYLAPRGHRMEPLPFPIAVWEIGTGENLSGNLVSGCSRQPLSDELVSTYGIARPSPLAHAWSGVRMTTQRVARRIERARGRAS